MVLTLDDIRERLPARDPNGHKGTFGKVLCVCGSVGYTGAPVFASHAAVRMGSGLVFLTVPRSIWQVLATKSDEAMPFPVADVEGKLSLAAEDSIRDRAADCDAVLLGCGLGRSEQTDELSRRLLSVPKPLVLDADGINALQGHIDTLACRRGMPTILTPHEGEFSRIGDLAAGREKAALQFAEDHGVVLVLKGPGTVIAAPDGRIAINSTGNCGMAKGGSGDVLSGMILSLLGQGLNAFDAACCGVYLHGLCGDIAAREKTEYAMAPTDMVDNISKAYKEILG